VFEDGSDLGSVLLELPTELRNEVSRLEVESEGSAASVFLVDERFKRRPIGLVSATEFAGAQPLLDELFYLDRAMEPFTEIRRGSIDTLLERELAVVVLADVAGVWAARCLGLDLPPSHRLVRPARSAVSTSLVR
jgi:hypothetical protein